MTTARDVRPEALAAGFDFAQKQSDPRFRRYLRKSGWKPGMSVMIALDGDKVSEVARRIAFSETEAPVMIAIPQKLVAFEFGLVLATVTPPHRRGWGRRRGAAVELHSESTIGMVWASGQRCGEFVPGDWFQPVMFETLAVAEAGSV